MYKKYSLIFWMKRNICLSFIYKDIWLIIWWKGIVRRLYLVKIVKSRSLRKSIHPARIQSNLPAKYVENYLQAVIYFRFIINTQNHSINQFTRKFLVDGRSTSQALETETLVFIIFVWFTSKCSFTTGFEVIKFAQLLHTFDSLV